jgi:hypothetical protein
LSDTSGCSEVLVLFEGLRKESGGVRAVTSSTRASREVAVLLRVSR